MSISHCDNAPLTKHPITHKHQMCPHPRLYPPSPCPLHTPPLFARLLPACADSSGRYSRATSSPSCTPSTSTSSASSSAAHARDRGAQRLGPRAAGVDVEGDTAAVPLLGRGHHRPCERGPGARGARVAGRVPGGDVEL